MFIGRDEFGFVLAYKSKNGFVCPTFREDFEVTPLAVDGWDDAETKLQLREGGWYRTEKGEVFGPLAVLTITGTSKQMMTDFGEAMAQKSCPTMKLVT